MLIDNNSIQGKIGELAKSKNIKMYQYNDLKTSIKCIKGIYHNITTSLGVDIETQGLKNNHNLLGIGIAIAEDTSMYFNTRDWSDDDIRVLITWMNKLPNIFIFHNSIFDCAYTGIRYGIPLKCEADTLIMYHTLLAHRQYYGEGLGLKRLTEDLTSLGNYESELEDYKNAYCKESKIKKSEFLYNYIPDEILSVYCCFDVIATLKLYNLAKSKIEHLIESGKWSNVETVIDIRQKANAHYIEAKIRGIQVNKDKVEELYEEWKEYRIEVLDKLMSNKEVKIAERNIRREVLKKAQEGRKSLMPLSRCRKLWKETTFNFSSSKHKIELFFNVMKLKPVEKTKKGAIGCGKTTIEHYIKKGLEVFELLEEYSKVDKGISAFLGLEGDKGIWNLTDEDSMIRSTHNLCGTISGRTTTKDINLAQIPSRGKLKAIKQCFSAGEGYDLVCFDYQNMESRMLATLSQQPELMKAFEEGYDTHGMTAFAIYKDEMELPQYEEFDFEIQKIIKDKYPLIRQRTKSAVFGISYGITKKGLAADIGSTEEEADKIINKYYETNDKIAEMVYNDKLFVCNNGYTENKYGARVYLKNARGYNFKDESRKNYNYKAISESRFVGNYQIQSCCAYYFYDCLNNFFDAIKENNMDVSLMMTIYDAIYIRVNKNVDKKRLVGLMYKHFAKEINGVFMGIDPAMASDGTWYNCEEIDLSDLKPEGFEPIKINL